MRNNFFYRATFKSKRPGNSSQAFPIFAFKPSYSHWSKLKVSALTDLRGKLEEASDIGLLDICFYRDYWARMGIGGEIDFFEIQIKDAVTQPHIYEYHGVTMVSERYTVGNISCRNVNSSAYRQLEAGFDEITMSTEPAGDFIATATLSFKKQTLNFNF